jgi:anhydro-N-acetylmuramic acid kinase
MERLAALVTARVTTTAEFGIGVDTKEAILFALLAYQTFQGRAGNLPSATGARKAVILGKICR